MSWLETKRQNKSEAQFREAFAAIQLDFPNFIPQIQNPGESGRDFNKRQQRAEQTIKAWNAQISLIEQKWNVTMRFIDDAKEATESLTQAETLRRTANQLATIMNSAFSSWRSWVDQELEAAYVAGEQLGGSVILAPNFATFRPEGQLGVEHLVALQNKLADLILLISQAPNLSMVAEFLIEDGSGSLGIATLHFADDAKETHLQRDLLQNKLGILITGLSYENSIIEAARSAISEIELFLVSVKTMAKAWQEASNGLAALLPANEPIEMLAVPLSPVPGADTTIPGNGAPNRVHLTHQMLAGKCMEIRAFTQGKHQGSLAFFEAQCMELLTILRTMSTAPIMR
ncbi:MAG: hypothetical protein O2840_02555 [bacterium]|nr:hypothetical protein [bacterium]